ncbi:MAG TPA: hypothetical protein VK557_11225 [Pyrinomonadaceae bacterium]|nr:hypothetical protein [Pyrinomonadaceae bacterium]
MNPKFINSVAMLVAVLLFNSLFVQLTRAQATDPIETIRQHYAAINKNVTLYRRVKKDLSGYSAEGGELIAYFHGPTIMKIAATFFGETGKTMEEYYYWDGKLIFVFRREAHYDKPLSGKVVSTIENRLYFKDDKMIRWIDENGKEVAAGSTEFAEKEKDYLKSSKEFSEGARGSSPTVREGL